MDPSVLQKYEQGEGSVYKAVKKVDGGIFAMRVMEALSEDEQKKNVEEVQHMLKLKHKNLVPCLDFFETTKQLARESLGKVWRVHIVMPLYGKGDLCSCVQKEGPLSPERADRLLREMGGVLQYIHSEGFIHRDVKPQNIMVSGKGPLSAASVTCGGEGEAEFILADLGLSKEVSSDGVANSFAGTPAYMAPDFFNGKDGYTNKVDMWALGVTVCNVVLQEDLRNLFLKYLHSNRELVMGKLQTHLPPALLGVVSRLLSTDPLERPSALEMLQTRPPGMVPQPTGKKVLLAVGSVGGEERKRKLCVAVGAGAEEVRMAAAKAFSSMGQELLRVRRLEVFDKDFGEFVEEDDGDIVFQDKGRVRVVFEAPLPTTTSTTRGNASGSFGAAVWGAAVNMGFPPATTNGTSSLGFCTTSGGFGTTSSGFGTASGGFGTGGFSTASSSFGTTSGGFGIASSGFSTASTGFGTTSGGFGTGGFSTASSSFGTASGGFGTTSGGFGTTSGGFGTTSGGFGTSGFSIASSSFGTALGGFGTASTGFGTTSGGFGTSGFSTASSGFGTALGGFGTASTGFGTASGGFGTTSGGFGTSGFSIASSSFSTALGGFGTASGGFGTTSGGFGTSGFSIASSSFGTALGGFGTASGGFGTASSGFGTASGGFGTASSGFGTASTGFGTTSGGFGTASGGFGTGGFSTTSGGFGTGGFSTASSGFGTALGGFGTASGGFGTAFGTARSCKKFEENPSTCTGFGIGNNKQEAPAETETANKPALYNKDLDEGVAYKPGVAGGWLCTRCKNKKEIKNPERFKGRVSLTSDCKTCARSVTFKWTPSSGTAAPVAVEKPKSVEPIFGGFSGSSAASTLNFANTNTFTGFGVSSTPAFGNSIPMFHTGLKTEEPKKEQPAETTVANKPALYNKDLDEGVAYEPGVAGDWLCTRCKNKKEMKNPDRLKGRVSLTSDCKTCVRSVTFKWTPSSGTAAPVAVEKPKSVEPTFGGFGTFTGFGVSSTPAFGNNTPMFVTGLESKREEKPAKTGGVAYEPGVAGDWLCTRCKNKKEMKNPERFKGRVSLTSDCKTCVMRSVTFKWTPSSGTAAPVAVAQVTW